MALLNCPGCGTTNRVPSILKQKMRCGKCKRDFTPRELVKARPEPAPARELQLESEDDDTRYACRKCGWQGSEDDCELDEDVDKLVCPDCGKRVKRVHQEVADEE